MAEIQGRLQALSDDFTKLQKELEEIVSSRQKLEAQRQENVAVQKVFLNLQEDETIFKKIGPVLLKQEKPEAESTISGRLDFIGKEISRLEAQIKEQQGKIEKKRDEIIQIQTSAETAMAAGSGKSTE